jgi:hypothetical protein
VFLYADGKGWYRLKIVVAVIIYNRFRNLQAWLNAWAKSDTTFAELLVIHNYDDKIQAEPYRAACAKSGVTYIMRPNIGHDIGALQDVCRERLSGFNSDYDFMLWCTDDTIPMRPSFIREYVNAWEKSETQFVCLEISDEHTRHIRTTGIYAPKYQWMKLQFPVDPHTELTHNYAFEHRGGEITMLRQLEASKVPYAQPWDLASAPMWDIDKRESLGRWDEWNGVFSDDPQVLFIATIHNSFPQIISSLVCQTYKNWRLRLIHDGLNHTELKRYIDAVADDRIEYLEMPDRVGRWGHPWRQWALERLRAGDYPEAKFVVITNADNYYVPVFCEYMVKGFRANTVATYCDVTVHSYWGATKEKGGNLWAAGKCEVRRGRIDCGGVMVRRMIAQEIGWRDIESHSSDWTYFEDIVKAHGIDKWTRVMGCLFTHN